MTTASSPEYRLHQLLASQQELTVATAESCTGGYVSGRITAVPGASAYFMGAVVSYAYAVKEQVLGIPRSLLDNPGAVSPECAALMAEAATRVLRATFAVSTTGIAGPTGATRRKPVGLVYIGVTGPSGTQVEEHVFPGDRQQVTDAATERALTLLTETVADYLTTNASSSGVTS